MLVHCAKIGNWAVRTLNVGGNKGGDRWDDDDSAPHQEHSQHVRMQQ